MLPLLRTLLDRDLNQKEPGPVYTSVSASLWFVWTPGAGVVLALAGLGLVLLACWRSPASVVSIGIAALASIGTVVLIVLFETGLLWATDQLAGVRPDWPANPWPWRGVIYAAPITAVALIGPWLARRLHGDAVMLGSWLAWGILTITMAWFLPLAAYMLIVPLLPAAIVCAALTFTSASPAMRGWFVAVVTPLAGWFLLGLAYGGELTQGFKLAPTIFGPLALLGIALLPVATVDRHRFVAGGAAAVIIVCLTMSAFVAPYSPNRPQHLNFVHVQDADSHGASLVVIAQDAIPPRVLAVAAFETNSQPFPWSDPTFTAAPIAAVPLSMATFVRPTPARGWRRYRVVAPEGAQMIRLWFTGTPFDANAEIAGHRVRVSQANDGNDFRSLTFHAPPASGVEFALEAMSDEPVTGYVAVYRSGLPRAAQTMSTARGDLAVAAFNGDMTVTYQKVSL